MTGQVCTCAGTAPGWPQHESFCGQPEPDEDDGIDFRPHIPTEYDVQEDAETGRCAACDATTWADQDLCDRCDCYDDYRRLAAIHAEYLPVYYPPCETTP